MLRFHYSAEERIAIEQDMFSAIRAEARRRNDQITYDRSDGLR
jgi:hypothetical protein